MRVLFGSFLAIVVSINGLIVLVASILVGIFSHFYFGIAVFVLGLLVIISSPKLNLKIGENQWSLGIPIFPGAKFFQIALLLTVFGSIAYAFLGEDIRDSSEDNFENSRAQKAMRDRIYIVSPSSYYWEKEGKWVILDNEMRAISLKERKEIPEGSSEIYLKMRLGDETGRFDGPVVWVSVLNIRKVSTPAPATGFNYSPPSAKVKKEAKKISEALEISFSPEQVVERDFHKEVPDKLLLVLDGFMQGDTFELAKDFSFRVRGDNPESWIFIGGLKVGSPIKGEIVELKKGMRFLISNGYSNIEFCSTGEQYEFSEFKIRKVL